VYTEPEAAALFWASYLVFVLIDARLIARSLSGRVAAGGEPVRGLVHRSVGLGWIIAADVVGLAAAAIGASVLPWPWVLLVLGVGLAWAGMGLRLSAKRTLGRFFVGAIVIQPDHHVVKQGAYAVVRHPGYAGSIVALTGFGIATANALTILLLTVVPTFVFVRTIRVEEAVLVESLGQEYVDYRRHTSRLIPHVW